jgi:hypothetical protein
MPTVKPNIFDGEQSRPMTDAEYAQWQTDNEAHAAQAAAVEAKAVARASALTKLAELGLTEAEVAAILGG